MYFPSSVFFMGWGMPWYPLFVLIILLRLLLSSMSCS